MRKIGIESGAYFNINSNFEQAFKKMKAHGFDCVDLNLADTYNTPESLYHKESTEQKRIISDLISASKATGIEIYQVHGPWRHPPKDATEEDRAEWSDYMKQGIKFTQALGCKHFVVHPIMPYGTGAEPDSKRYYELNYEFFKNLIPAAEQAGVIICVENMPFLAHSLATPEQISNFVADLESDSVAMCLDTGHSIIRGVSPADGVYTMGKKLKAMHVHDNDGKGDRHECPFYGVIDWDAFKKALKETVSEDVPLMLETRPGKRIPSEVRSMLLPGFAAAARWLAN